MTEDIEKQVQEIFNEVKKTKCYNNLRLNESFDKLYTTELNESFVPLVNFLYRKYLNQDLNISCDYELTKNTNSIIKSKVNNCFNYNNSVGWCLKSIIREICKKLNEKKQIKQQSFDVIVEKTPIIEYYTREYNCLFENEIKENEIYFQEEEVRSELLPINLNSELINEDLKVEDDNLKIQRIRENIFTNGNLFCERNRIQFIDVENGYYKFDNNYYNKPYFRNLDIFLFQSPIDFENFFICLNKSIKRQKIYNFYDCYCQLLKRIQTDKVYLFNNLDYLKVCLKDFFYEKDNTNSLINIELLTIVEKQNDNKIIYESEIINCYNNSVIISSNSELESLYKHVIQSLKLWRYYLNYDSENKLVNKIIGCYGIKISQKNKRMNYINNSYIEHITQKIQNKKEKEIKEKEYTFDQQINRYNPKFYKYIAKFNYSKQIKENLKNKYDNFGEINNYMLNLITLNNIDTDHFSYNINEFIGYLKPYTPRLYKRIVMWIIENCNISPKAILSITGNWYCQNKLEYKNPSDFKNYLENVAKQINHKQINFK